MTELRPVHHGVTGSSGQRGAWPSFLCVGDSPAPLRRAAASSILSSWLQDPGAAIFPRTQLVPGGPASPSSAARFTAPPGQCVGHRDYQSRNISPTPGHLGEPQASPRPSGVGHVLRDGRAPAPALWPPSSCPPRCLWAPEDPNPQPPFVSPGRWRRPGRRAESEVLSEWHAATARKPR